jgi:tRNA-binding protein
MRKIDILARGGFILMAEFKDFMKLDIRVGKIIRVEDFETAADPAYKLWLDFGEEIGEKKSSAQITDLYKPEDLIEKQVLAVINFPPKQIADFMSEVLVLGVYGEKGVVLIEPDQEVKPGSRIG